MSSFAPRLAASVVACACALPALAHEEEDTVDVIHRYDAGVGLWDAASQGAVTGDGINKRPLLRPGEVLESVPGMIVTQHSGDGKANQFFLRGYNLDHGTDFATWLNGMPINMPTHAHGQGYTDLNFLIPELIGRIVYNKGPYFAEDGDFGSAGSARIRYVDHLHATLAQATAGSFGYRRALLAGSPELGSGRLLYAADLQGYDGPWDTPTDLRRFRGVLRYSSGTAANGWSVMGMGYSARWNSTDQIPQRAVDSGTLGRFGAIDPSDGGRTSRTSLSGEWRKSERDGSYAANFYLIRSRLDLFSNFTYFLNDPVNGDQFQQAERRSIAGGSVSRTWVGKLGDYSSSTVAGVQFRSDGLAPVALYNTVAQQRLSTMREDRVRVASFSPYVQNTLEWTRWLKTIAGLRFDHFNFRVDSDNPLNSGRARDSMASPKLSLVLGPWQRTELFANWGHGFHSNDARGTTITVDPATGAAAQRVDPLVRTRGEEIGVRTQPAKTLTTSLALWRLEQASELLFVGDAGTTEPSRPSRRTGLEALAQYDPRSWLSLDASLAFTRARFSTSDPAGDFIPGAPDKVASAGLTVEGLHGWFGSLRWRYFGPRPLVEDNSVRSQSTSLVNLRVGYAFNKKTRLSFDIYNLFNARQNDIDYFYASQLRGEPAPVLDRHFHPVESRAARVTLALEF
ncbi:MAG TPA: TonB-dependent receptor [Burkholderiales bacterium]|nr:TonB-dependent receptor [Burkholderiales bacterium]